MTKINLDPLFDDITENMLQSFEGWDTYIPHEGEKGGIRERRVLDFFKRHLPYKYGVASGHIIDRQGNASLQEDIVIFDRLNCPVLQVDDYYQIFPCETVYATVEVKSTLNLPEIDACINHTQELRTLYRKDPDGKDLGPIESFVFAYDTYNSKKFPPAVWAAQRFSERATSTPELKPLPGAILCLKKKFVLHIGGMYPDKHIAHELGSGVLAYYLDILLRKISQVQTSIPSLFFQYGWSQGLKHYGGY